MPPQEVISRGVHLASTWLERVTALQATPDAEALLAKKAPALACADSALATLRTIAPLRFFEGVEHPETARCLQERMPDACRQVMSMADRLMSGRFDLLGYKDLSFGDPIDWQLDPVWGRRTELIHWSLLDPLDHERVGDSKVVWEINRHQWIVQLAHASVLSGDARYALSAVAAIDDWIARNPTGFGINWTSSLEVSYRLMSWCWALMFLRDSRALTGERLARVLAAMWQHANYVRKHLSYYFSPNTHLTGEALGLLYAGTLFPEFTDARRWRELGAGILLSELTTQTSRDAVHFEQSTCYHRYTADTYLQFLLLAERNGIPVPAEARSHIARMVDFLVGVQQPDGTLPLIGDTDGGRALPFLPHKAADAGATLAIAAAVFDRADFAAAAGAPRIEAAWLAGPRTARSLEQVDLAAVHRASSIFDAGGYAVTRSEAGADAHQMIVDVGPLGCPHTSGHGHADLLSVQCSVFGDPCLVDAGTYCYTPDPEWRGFFRGSRAHSTVVVDGQSQADAAAPFAWHHRPDAHLNMWLSGESVDYVDGHHEAYRRLTDPVVHRRRVAFVKPHYWVVVDDLYGTAEHALEIQFQFAPMAVDVDSQGRACAHTRRGHDFWILPFPSSTVEAQIFCGVVNPPRGWISKDYGQRTPAPMLVYSTAAVLPWRMLTLLLPVARGSARPPLPELIQDEAGLPCGLQFDAALPSVNISRNTLVVGTSVLPVRGLWAAA